MAKEKAAKSTSLQALRSDIRRTLSCRAKRLGLGAVCNFATEHFSTKHDTLFFLLLRALLIMDPCSILCFFPFPLIPSAGYESLMRPINKAKSALLNAAQLTTASAFSLGGRCSDALATL